MKKNIKGTFNKFVNIIKNIKEELIQHLCNINRYFFNIIETIRKFKIKV